MAQSNELQEIRGIGEALAERLAQRGIDSLDKLAEASEKDLSGIDGLPNNRISGVLRQAHNLAAQEQRSEESLAELVEDADHLRDQTETLVLNIRDRFSADKKHKVAPKALRKEIYRTLASLEKIEAVLGEQMRRMSDKLAKADAKLANISDSSPEEIAAGLKKARKKLDKAVD